jgi:hypothetical protein
VASTLPFLIEDKNGKVNEMPRHHKLEAYMDAYIAAAGIEADHKEPLSGLRWGARASLPPVALARRCLVHGALAHRRTDLEYRHRLGKQTPKPPASMKGAMLVSVPGRWRGWGFELQYENTVINKRESVSKPDPHYTTRFIFPSAGDPIR